MDYLLHFLDNHGIIGYPSTVQWRVVAGGSWSTCERIVASLPAGAVRAAARSSACATRRRATVTTEDGYREDFDAVVMATHADDTLRMLRDADDRERGRSAASSTP